MINRTIPSQFQIVGFSMLFVLHVCGLLGTVWVVVGGFFVADRSMVQLEKFGSGCKTSLMVSPLHRSVLQPAVHRIRVHHPSGFGAGVWRMDLPAPVAPPPPSFDRVIGETSAFRTGSRFKGV